MIDLPAAGDILTDPEGFARATRAWVEANAAAIGSVAAGALAVSGAAGFGWAAISSRLRRRRAERLRFGGKRAARGANLLRNPGLAFSGIPVGRIGGARLCWVDEEPVLVTGGTRSGKGTGIIRPACLTYGGPMVMYDGGKGELFRDTSGYRARFSHVLNLDLTDPCGVHFNPLDEIGRDNPVAGADNLARAVPRPADADNHFEAAADRLIAAVILHVLHGEDAKTLAEVTHLIARGDKGMARIVRAAAHPVAVDRVNGLFGGDVFGADAFDGIKYRQSVYNSALVRLSAFEDPVVAAITSRSDFRMRDLFRLSPSKRPVSLYLTTPASEDERLRPVVSLFLALFINSVLAEQPRLEGQPPTLIVADEFPSLRMEILQTAITKIVGCGATMLLGAQSLNALRQPPYGPYNLFRDNIRCHVAFAANDGMTQQEIARSCGTVSESRKSHSRSRQFGSWAGSSTESETEFEAPAMDAGAVRELPDDQELIFVTGQPVIRARKIRDYRDGILKKRLNLPCPPMRGADGVYPDLPQPVQASPWAGAGPARAGKEPPAGKTAKQGRKRRLIAARGDDD